MKMKRKKIASVLLSAMVLTCNAFTFQAPLCSAAAERAALTEGAVPFDYADGLEEDAFSPDKVNILLKKAYSRKYERLLKKIFSDPMFKDYEVISDPETASEGAVHLFVSADLNGKGKDAIRKALDYLQTFDEIYYAGPNNLYSIELQYYPNDPGLSAAGVKDLAGNYKKGQPAYQLMELDKAWNITTGASSFVVGNAEEIFYAHEDIRGQMWINPNPKTPELHGANFTGKKSSVYNESDGNHGTITGGCMIAAGNNSKGSAGVVYGAKLMSVCANSDAQFRKMIEFLNQNRVRVLNISQGWGKDFSKEIIDAINSYDGLIFASAGNDAKCINNAPYFPASYANIKSQPLSVHIDIRKKVADKVIAVAAVNNDDTLADYSNYGTETVKIAAPADVVTTNAVNHLSVARSDYGIYSGTSCASPVAAGVASLIWSANPALSAAEVKDILFRTADTVPSLKGKVEGGRRINAYKALLAASCDAGTYFFRSKANARYLDLNTSTKALITHDYNGNKNQQFAFGNGTLKTCHFNTNNYIGRNSSNSKTMLTAAKTDIAVAKDPNGRGYRIITTFRTQMKDGEGVVMYALEVTNPNAAVSEVVWRQYDESSYAQLWDLKRK